MWSAHTTAHEMSAPVDLLRTVGAQARCNGWDADAARLRSVVLSMLLGRSGRTSWPAPSPADAPFSGADRWRWWPGMSDPAPLSERSGLGAPLRHAAHIAACWTAIDPGAAAGVHVVAAASAALRSVHAAADHDAALVLGALVDCWALEAGGAAFWGLPLLGADRCALARAARALAAAREVLPGPPPSGPIAHVLSQWRARADRVLLGADSVRSSVTTRAHRRL